MAVKTKHQARTQVGDSDLLEGSRALSTRPSLNMKRAQRKSRQNPVSLDEGHNLLLDLPPELRNIVYEYYVASEEPFYVVDSWVSKRSRVPSLLIVNRQIRKVHYSMAVRSSPTPAPQSHQRDLLDFWASNHIVMARPEWFNEI